MEYRTQLERLMTLDADAIAQACAGERINALVTRCYDEYLELRELAEECRDGAPDRFAYYLQEASAWRDTVRVLRELSTQLEASTDAVQARTA